MTREGAVKWAKEIKAFQEGKIIQGRRTDNNKWQDMDYPEFNEDYNYRVKPEKKIDVATDMIVSAIESKMAAIPYPYPYQISTRYVRKILQEVYGDE